MRGISTHDYVCGCGIRLAMLSLLCVLLLPGPGQADGLRLQSFSLRVRVSGQDTLGRVAPEEFQEVDLAANLRLPWESYSDEGGMVGTRVMASAGVLRGAGRTALALSLIPEMTMGTADGRFLLDLGVGGALLSRSRFGSQDFGGPFQFALTAGVTLPLYRKLGVGYRFLHYSDAGLNGPDTIGADFHMIEFSYRR